MLFYKHINNVLMSSANCKHTLFFIYFTAFMNEQLFLSWLRTIFVPNAGDERPVLLIIDNLTSHTTMEVLRYARENKVLKTHDI